MQFSIYWFRKRKKEIEIMSLFGKKKDEKKMVKEQSGCCCGGNCNEESVEAAKETLSSGANVKVLGGGCDKCNALEKNVKEALSELGMTDEIDHVTDFGQIAAMGVMSTPALVIDNKVVSMGKVLSKDDRIMELVKLLATDSILKNDPDKEFDELRFAVDDDGTNILVIINKGEITGAVDIDNMYEFASSHCDEFKDLRDDEDIVINREWILNKLAEAENE